MSLLHLKHELKTGAKVEDVGHFVKMKGMARRFKVDYAQKVADKKL